MSGMARTKPGSIAHTIADCVRDTVTTAARGLTLSEHRAAYEARHGSTPETYAAQFFSLSRRGIVVAVDGRTSQTLYAHRDNELAGGVTLPSADPEDDAVAVLTALTRAVQVAGCPVSTEEVGAWLSRLGLRLRSRDINAVRVRLKTLARRRQRGLSAWSEPRVRAIRVESVGGRPMLLWEPIGRPEMPATSPPRPLTASDAVRELVLHVQQVLGRPVFRRELQWWLEAHLTHPVAIHAKEYLTGGRQTLAQILVATAAADARRLGPGRLDRVALGFTCWGGVAPRFWVGDLPPVARLATTLEEVANGLRVADEVSALGVLARRTAQVRIPAVARLLEARRGALSRALTTYFGSDVEAIRTAMDVLLTGYAYCRTWAASGARTEDGRYARLVDLDERERHVRALPPAAAEPPSPRTFRCVGPESATSTQDLEPFLDAAAMELEMTPRLAWRTCLKGVRRIPLAAPGESRWGAHPERGDVAYDRVDAVLHVYRMAPASRTRALLDVAAELLGPVLREPSLLKAITASPRATPGLRRAAMVALGLLGVAPGAAERQRCEAGDVLDGRALLLAVTLSGQEGWPDTFDDPSLAQSVRRLAAGRLLTALG